MITSYPEEQPSLRNELLFVLLVIAAGFGIAAMLFFLGNSLFALAVIGALVLAAAIFVKPEIGLLILVFLTFTRAPIVAPGLGDLPNVSMVLSIGLILVLLLRQMLYQEPPGGWRIPLLLFGSFAVIGSASLLWAGDSEAVITGLIEYFKDILIAMAVLMSIRSVKTLHLVIWTLLLAGTFLGALSVYQSVLGSYTHNFLGFAQVREMNIVGEISGIRIIGPGLEPNTYGLYMIFLIPLALDRLWLERNLLLKLLAFVALNLITFTVIFTFSRSAFIALVFTLAMFFILRPPKPSLVLLTFILLPILWGFIPHQYTNRIATLFYLVPGMQEESTSGLNVTQAAQDSSFRGRLSENIVGLRMTMDYPILGVGLDNFKVNYLEYSSELGLDSRREDRGAHNLYLELTSELGILGITWFVVFNWVAFRGLFHARRTLIDSGFKADSGIAYALALSLMSFLFGSIFRHLIYPTHVWLFYAIIFSVPYVARRLPVTDDQLDGSD